MNALFSVVSLIGLLFAVFYLYNEFRVDRLRQQLFALRDDLFDQAADGRIAFESGAYQATRLMLNGMIRFGHRASLSHILASRCMLRDEHRAYARQLFEGIAFTDSPEADRKLCRAYIMKANLVIAGHCLTSPFLLVCLVPALLLIASSSVASAMVRQWKTAFAAMDREALEEGRAAVAR